MVKKNNAILSIGGNEYSSRQVIDSAHGSTAFTEGYNTYMSGLDTYKSYALLHRGQESLSIGEVLKYDADAGSADNYHLWANTTYTWNGGWYAQ